MAIGGAADTPLRRSLLILCLLASIVLQAGEALSIGAGALRIAADGTVSTGVDDKAGPRCLKYMHIPKTGGTSLESANLHLPQGHRAFDSFAVPVYEAATTWLPGSAAEIFDMSHANPEAYAPWFTRLNHTWVKMPDGNVCHNIHTPPAYDHRVAEYFSDNCTVFCAVREPLQRFLATYKFNRYGPCSVAGFENFVSFFMDFLKKQPFEHVCHWVPQVEFVYGAKSREASTHQYCHRVLHQEHLNDEFAALMAEFGQDLKLKEYHNMFSSANCRIDLGAVSKATKNAVYNYYRADYDAFGYPPPA